MKALKVHEPKSLVVAVQKKEKKKEPVTLLVDEEPVKVLAPTLPTE
jgi:hypothetical protein